MTGGSLKEVYACFYNIQLNPPYFVYDGDLMIETFKNCAIHEMKIFNIKKTVEQETKKSKELNLELGAIQSLFHSTISRNVSFARMRKSSSLFLAVRKLISVYRKIFVKDFYKIAAYEERKIKGVKQKWNDISDKDIMTLRKKLTIIIKTFVQISFLMFPPMVSDD